MGALAIFAYASSLASLSAGTGWEVLPDCRLAPDAPQGGDYSDVIAGEQRYRFRLYFVEAAASERGPAEALEDQSRYFNLPAESITPFGKRAESFARSFLEGGFEVITKWEQAGGSGPDAVHLAFIRRDGEDLSLELAAKGLVRIYGVPPSEPWPGGTHPEAFLYALKQAERSAQKSKAGIWSAAADSIQMTGSDLQAVSGGAAFGSVSTLNINRAPAEELMTLPGIGPALAERIIGQRPFESVDAISSVPGISKRMLDAFREQIRLSDPAPPEKTARFYLDDPDSHSDRDVVVTVQSVAGSDQTAPDSFRSVTLHTAHDGQDGGSITAFIPEEYYESFKQFHLQPGREFRGLFHRHEGEWVLVYQRR